MSQDARPLFAEMLACPRCHGPLRRQGQPESWICNEHGTFPVVSGFPSFAQGDIEIFEDHWLRNATTTIADHKIATAEAFLQPLLRRRSTTSQAFSILDAGCGEGAHVAVLSRRPAACDSETCVGLDIAASALHECKRVASTNWDFVHADMMELPFANERFDAVFTFGVLALTPDPRTALSELARVLKPGGLLGLWVFPGDNPLVRTGLRGLRALSRALGPSGATIVANMIVPFYGLLPTRSGLTISGSSWRQTREVLMSNLTPPFMHFLDAATLRNWFSELGLSVTEESDGERITLWGEKRG